MASRDPKASPAGSSTRPAIGAWLERGLSLRPGLEIEAEDLAGPAPAVIGADDKNGTWFLPVRLRDDDGAERHAMLRGVRLDGPAAVAPEALDRWRSEHRLLARSLRKLTGLVRAVDGVGAASAPVLPALHFCTEKKVFVPAPGVDVAEPLDALWRAVRQGGAAGAAGSEAPCVTCGERDRCYPASGASRDPGTAGARLTAISDRPWGALLVEPFHLPFSAWIRLASGESWRAVRSSLEAWPPSLVARLDRILGVARPTILGPEHGVSFALETLLLRLEWLRQVLETLRGLAQGPRRPHLALGARTIAIAIDPPGVWGAPLWSSRVQFLTAGAIRVTADGSFEPLPGRSAAMVPPECRGGAAWVRGRCLPRGATKTLGSAKSWEFHFLPTESATQAPARGTAVRFAVDESGEPAGGTVDGRIDVAFRDVWMVTVQEPGRFESLLREMLTREEGRPSIVMQAVSDHGLADDLYAVGTLWLSSLAAEPGSVPAAVRLREALRAAPPEAAQRDVVESAGPIFYPARGGEPERQLPAELIDAALDLGNRLCGGIAGSFPGQAHEPVALDKRVLVYERFLAEVAALASEVRHRMLGFAPADAEVRALLESAFRSA